MSLLKLDERFGGLSCVELVNAFDEEVSGVPVEADGPPVEEAFVAEEGEGESLVEDKVGFGFPAEVVEGWEDEIAGGGHGRPVATQDGDPPLGFASVVGELDAKKVPDAARENAPWCASVDQGFCGDRKACVREPDVDGWSKDRCAGGETFLFPPREGVDAARDGSSRRRRCSCR
jgi:hypothetical protein